MSVTFEPVPKSLGANRETYEVLDPQCPLRAIEWTPEGTILNMYHGTQSEIAAIFPEVVVPDPHDLAVALRDNHPDSQWEEYRG